MKIKKLISLVLCCLLALCLPGCSSADASVQIQDGVEFSLLDVLEVDNAQSNTVFYYFLGSVQNDSDTEYHMSNLHYVMTSKDHTTSDVVNPIDQYQAILTNDVRPGMSSFVYGYIGVPRTGDKNLGLYFSTPDEFIPFNSVKIRTIDDKNVTNSDEKAFTIYEDSSFEFDVDATNLTYRYEDGKSIIDGLVINYKNKTDNRLVVPFLVPICTINGIELSSLPDAQNYQSMSEEELRQQNFSSNGLDAKTTPVTCSTYGYQLFYLPAQQEIPVRISFEAEGVIPDFSSSNKDGITININSPSLGYSQIINVPY